MTVSSLRRAGSGTSPDGATVLWSVAEGSRGRRWRWTVSDGSRLRHSGLLELDRAGRFARLELDDGSAMVTLHPEPDGRSAHGNVVTADGVWPIAIDWAPERGVAIGGDAFGSTLCAGEGSGVVISGDRVAEVLTAADGSGLGIDARGVPKLANSSEWALEV